MYVINIVSATAICVAHNAYNNYQIITVIYTNCLELILMKTNLIKVRTYKRFRDCGSHNNAI